MKQRTPSFLSVVFDIKTENPRNLLTSSFVGPTRFNYRFYAKQFKKLKLTKLHLEIVQIRNRRPRSF